MSDTYKIVIIGDGNVGKTTFVNKMIGVEMKLNGEYLATLGVNIEPVRFDTTFGPVSFNLWDCAGNEKFQGLGDGYYCAADGAIIMCDLTNIQSINNVKKWNHSLKRTAGTIPTIIIGTKSDLCSSENLCKIEKALSTRKISHPYYSISSLSNYNLYEPLQELARQLTSKPTLRLIKNLYTDIQPKDKPKGEQDKQEKVENVKQPTEQLRDEESQVEQLEQSQNLRQDEQSQQNLWQDELSQQDVEQKESKSWYSILKFW